MRKQKLIHPGEHLREILAEIGVSHYRFAHASGIPASAVCTICAGRRAITAANAIRIARALNMTPEFWIRFQARYDFERAQLQFPPSKIAKIATLPEAAKIAP